MTRITRAVHDLLVDTSQDAAPVDVQAIADSLGLRVIHTKLSDDVSGMLIRDTQTRQNTVGVNQDHARTRQRFTLAHEIGHFQLHPGRPLIVDSPVRVNLRDSTSGMATNREEMEANRFAAELLMPADLVLDEIARVNTRTTKAPQKRLAKLFGVSDQAMGYRLVNLGVLSSGEF